MPDVELLVLYSNMQNHLSVCQEKHRCYMAILEAI